MYFLPIFQDIAKLLASSDRYGRQINSQHEFLTDCRNELNASFAELNGVLAQVRAAGLEQRLALFIANKESEMQVFFAKISTDHCNKLIVLFKAEANQAHEALTLCSEVAQDQYLLLRGNKVDVDAVMSEQQERLLSLLEHKGGVRFNDENLQDTVTQLTDLSKEAELNSPTSDTQHRSSFDAAKVLSAMSSGGGGNKKRRNLFVVDDAVQGDSTGRKVRILEIPAHNGLDQTIVLSTAGSGKAAGGGIDGVEPLMDEATTSALNGTFQMPAPSKGGFNETVHLVGKSVLKEQNLNKIMNQPGLVTKMARTAVKAGGGVRNGGDRMVKKVGVVDVGGAGGGGRGSPNRVAKARLAASRTGVAAVKSKAVGGRGSGGGGNEGGRGQGSAHKRKWK